MKARRSVAAQWRTVGDFLACVADTPDFAATVAARWLAWAQTLDASQPFPSAREFVAWERATFDRSELTGRTWAEIDGKIHPRDIQELSLGTVTK